jgi:hypothetical protein
VKIMYGRFYLKTRIPACMGRNKSLIEEQRA